MDKSTVISGTLRRDAKLLVLDVDGGEQLVLGPASLCGPDLDLRGPGKVRVNVSGKRHPGTCACLGKHGLPHLELDWMRVEGVPPPEPWAQQAARHGVADPKARIMCSDCGELHVCREECPVERHWTDCPKCFQRNGPDTDDCVAYHCSGCGHDYVPKAPVVALEPHDGAHTTGDGQAWRECNGSGSEADNQEMKTIRDRWGFS